MSSIPVAMQPPDGLGAHSINTDLPVRAILDSSHPEPVTWLYARQKYVIHPGVPTFVHYMAMCMYQGDPRAVDLPTGREHEQYRRNEYARLHIVHGVYEGSEGHRKWTDVAPISCYPIDSDVPFNTVLRDPEGVNLAAEKQDMSQSKFLQDQMESMAAQMRIMQAQLANQQAADGAISAANVDPADLDRQATVARGVMPESLAESMVGASPTRRGVMARKVKDADGNEAGTPPVTTDA